MCLPAAALMIAGTAMSAAGTIYGGISSMQTANANARALQEQARLREEKGKYDVETAERRYRREEGKAVADIGASGVSAASFYDILSDNAAESAVEKQAIKFGATVDANNLRTQASIQKMQGKSAMIGSIFSAGGTMAAGYGKVGAMRMGAAGLEAQYGG